MQQLPFLIKQNISHRKYVLSPSKWTGEQDITGLDK